MIPLSIPNFVGNEEKYVLDAVSQGWVSTGGAYVEQLQKDIATYIKAPGAVSCQSGTAALHLSLIECNVGIDDMVIVPTLTFIAAVNPVKYVHATPIFMDCDDTLCMDPIKLKSFCEEECLLKEDVLYHSKTGKAVKAIIVVHVFGNLADMESIMKIAATYHLKVIEDATEALGSYFTEGIYKGKMAGIIGDFGAFSFNGNKIITTGGGGAIVSKDEKSIEHLKYLSTQAKDDALFYVHNEVGYNYRMTNVQAAIGVAQMENLENFVKIKNANYDQYEILLQGISSLRILPFCQNIRSNKWFYSILIDREKITDDLKTIVHKLADNGIQTRTIWGLIHEQKPYMDCFVYKVEKAKYYSQRILNVPCSTNLQSEDILKVCEALKKL